MTFRKQMKKALMAVAAVLTALLITTAGSPPALAWERADPGINAAPAPNQVHPVIEPWGQAPIFVAGAGGDEHGPILERRTAEHGSGAGGITPTGMVASQYYDPILPDGEHGPILEKVPTGAIA